MGPWRGEAGRLRTALQVTFGVIIKGKKKTSWLKGKGKDLAKLTHLQGSESELIEASAYVINRWRAEGMQRSPGGAAHSALVLPCNPLLQS